MNDNWYILTLYDKIFVIMKIKGRFDHFNINVLDLERSINFYSKALGLQEVKRKKAPDGSFILSYLGDGETDFLLE